MIGESLGTALKVLMYGPMRASNGEEFSAKEINSPVERLVRSGMEQIVIILGDVEYVGYRPLEAMLNSNASMPNAPRSRNLLIAFVCGFCLIFCSVVVRFRGEG